MTQKLTGKSSVAKQIVSHLKDRTPGRASGIWVCRDFHYLNDRATDLSLNTKAALTWINNIDRGSASLFRYTK
jgi:hypothetical protein